MIARSANDFLKCLNDFEEYCNTWKLQININKTKVMIFGTNRRTWRKYSFKINDEIVDNYKYLGIVFSPTGKFNKPKNEDQNKH